ncbi:MAG: DoxX family membrane protein [Acidobacteria bacterium]|nr:DoxX family membrane protein [Acidobacteriota bacterium]
MDRMDTAYRTLRLTYGLVPLLAGLDKFFNLLADWPGYLSPAAAAMLPVSPATFMQLVGLVEMTVGLLVLTRYARLGAYVAAGWLVLIALNLGLAGRFDVAVRDLAMAAGAFALARLHEARATAPARERRPAAAFAGTR